MAGEGTITHTINTEVRATGLAVRDNLRDTSAALRATMAHMSHSWDAAMNSIEQAAKAWEEAAPLK